MAASHQKAPRTTTWYQRLITPEQLEAPDRNFAGHRDILTRNLARYQFIAGYVFGAALEVGCGRGYGLEIIRPKVDSAVGVDVSFSFLADSARPAPLVQASGIALPFADRQFDSIIAFEVIEHIQNDQAFVLDLIRAAHERALIAISTPNRLIASGQAGKPLDPYHVREYTGNEFRNLLQRHFSSVSLYGQHDRMTGAGATNRLIDRIPIRWKYVLPAAVQGWLSVKLRQPLQLSDCYFDTDNLDHAHTLLAVCHV